MDRSNVVKTELTSEEDKEMREGQALLEMVQNSEGWRIVRGWLEDRMNHTWVDPMGAESKEKWLWQEENAFHAANNAKILLEDIDKLISRADYLTKVKAGEIINKKMKI